ncbi:MAG TPA: L-lactate dehydrogenase [Bacteroidota bacterium]|nr:L-lactate dehydrogenase [Bacteroidota bacterium]
MKIGIVGSGMVGATAAYAVMLRKAASEIVLVDANPARARAEAEDIRHAVPFADATDIAAGTYEDFRDATVIVIAAGASQKPGETRLMLMERNAAILEEIVAHIARVNPAAILLVATNPVDIITHLATRLAERHGIPASRVIGTGTTLDTARFRSLLGRQVGVDPQNVHAYVIGEHGDSEVLTWSNIDIGGLPLDAFVRFRNIPFDEKVRRSIDDGVRTAAYSIIAGKGSTYYGIGGAIAKLVDVINRDNRAVLTVSTRTADVEGVRDVTLSFPHLIGGKGDLGILPIPLSPEEKNLLRQSALLIRSKLDEYERRA